MGSHAALTAIEPDRKMRGMALVGQVPRLAPAVRREGREFGLVEMDLVARIGAVHATSGLAGTPTVKLGWLKSAKGSNEAIVFSRLSTAPPQGLRPS